LGGLASAAMLNLAACESSSPSSSTQAKTLQLSFWGDASRNKLTHKAITAYNQEHSDITINTWSADFSSYFNKLNTQIAGGSIPDLIQMDMAYVAQYVDQNLLLNLSSFISNKTIDLSDFDQQMLANSEDNKVPYGIPLGGNYEALIYDTTLVKQAGLSNPPTSWTWDDFATYTGNLSQALKANNIYGTADASGAIDVFEIWVRQHGHELYTPDGKVAFTLDDVTSWFDYWDKLRKAGACASAQLQATSTGSGPSASLLAQGKAVFATGHSNQLSGFQVLTKHTLAMQSVPNGSGPGLYLKPSMLMSVAAKSKYTNEAADFINFIITKPAGVKAIGLDRGVPGSTSARTTLQPTLKPVDKLVLAFQEQIASSGNTRPKTILDPAGAGKLQTALQNASQAIGFGKQSVADGAKTFFQQATQALAK
jgi:multiple sugar transport system substrate-binding protein